MKDIKMAGRIYPTYGAETVFTYVIVRGKLLPAVGFTDQFFVRLPDGTHLFIEPWDCESPFEGKLTSKRDNVAIKEREMRRIEQGLHRNSPSTNMEIDLAFRRNAGKFVEDT